MLFQSMTIVDVALNDTLDLCDIPLNSTMSVFSGLNNLKDALDDVIHDDQKDPATGNSKTHKGQGTQDPEEEWLERQGESRFVRSI